MLNRWRSISDVPATMEVSWALSKDLKWRWFKFCGPVIGYALIQATGFVNNPMVGRHWYPG